jgi:hypothetical protein
VPACRRGLEWILKHPNDPARTARYGHDLVRGYWAEVEDTGMTVTWDQNDAGFDDHEPVLSVLYFIAHWGFVDGDDVNEAVDWLSLAPSCRVRPRRGVRRALRVISNLERAGG